MNQEIKVQLNIFNVGFGFIMELFLCYPTMKPQRRKQN